MKQSQQFTVGSGDVLQLDFKLEPEFDLEAYAKILREKAEQSNPMMTSFALGYMDKDNIPELIVGSMGGYTNYAEIYTMNQEGEVFQLNVYAPYGSFRFSPGNGLIRENVLNQGVSVYTFEEFVDREINTLSAFRTNAEAVGEANAEYYVDGIAVSKDYYDTNLADWEDNYYFVTFYYDYTFALTEDNINLMLEDPTKVMLE